MKTEKIKELGIEVTKEELHKGKSYNEVKKLIPKGWRLLKGWEAIFLWENYRDKLKLDWFFVEPIKGFTVARLYSYSVGVFIICDWDPGCSVSWLGVRFCKELEK